MSDERPSEKLHKEMGAIAAQMETYSYGRTPESPPEPDPLKIYPGITSALEALGMLHPEVGRVTISLGLRPEWGAEIKEARPSSRSWIAFATMQTFGKLELPHVSGGESVDYKAMSQAISNLQDKELSSVPFEGRPCARLGDAVASLQNVIEAHLQHEVAKAESRVYQLRGTLRMLRQDTEHAEEVRWPVEDIEVDPNKVIGMLIEVCRTNSWHPSNSQTFLKDALAYGSTQVEIQAQIRKTHKEGLEMWQSMESEEQAKYFEVLADLHRSV